MLFYPLEPSEKVDGFAFYCNKTGAHKHTHTPPPLFILATTTFTTTGDASGTHS